MLVDKHRRRHDSDTESSLEEGEARTSHHHHRSKSSRRPTEDRDSLEMDRHRDSSRRRHDDESLEKRNGEREVLDEVRDSTTRGHRRREDRDSLDKVSKSKIDQDGEIRGRGDRRRHHSDSSDENFEKFSKSKRQNQNGEREIDGGKDRHDEEKLKERKSRREVEKTDERARHEDVEKLHKSEIRGRGDRRRHDSDSSNSDEELEKISKNQNGEREIRSGNDRAKTRHSEEEEEKLKERKSRSDVEEVDERGRFEDNYRRRGTDENYRDREKEKKLERGRDERHDDRRGKRVVGEEDEDRYRRRERDGHDHREAKGEDEDRYRSRPRDGHDHREAKGEDEDRYRSRPRDGHDHREAKGKDDNGKKLGNVESKASAPRRTNVVNADAANLGRAGGIYIPPFKLAQMMRNVEDKSSVEYQRLTWDALRKSINGLVNKVNAANIKNIVTELFEENLIRGRGLFCRSCMKSQMASPGFTDVFSALVAVVNTKFPEVGELLLRRIVLQLKRAYKRHDKHQLLAAVKFVAHLVNQQVAHEIIALELLTLLLEEPTDDSVEVAVGFVTECGSLLQDLSPQGLHGIFERFRGILHEGEIDKRVQFLIEGLFAVRKSKFQGHPAIRAELDLVDQEDQLTHELSLQDEIDPETSLDIFKADPQFVENEKRYEALVKNILGDESNKDEASSDEASDDDEDSDPDEEEEEQMQIKDETETNLVNLRRTIYLTIMSSVDFEEAGHKLLKIKLEPGQEMELCIMLLECCSQERTYLRYYGLLGQRFCMINKIHQENFETCFVQQYSMIHRLETNKLRNVAKFFAHLLGTDALPWHVLSYIRLTEEDTTSSSRIFIKILFQELSEQLGIRLLNERLTDPGMQDSFESIFPKDNPKNTRFSINFFTSIGLGGITENLREYLKNMPRLIMQQQTVAHSDVSGSSSPPSSSSSSSSSSDEEARRKRRKRR